MRIQIISDVHLEFAKYDLIDTSADVIIAAGDIGLGLEGAEWLKSLNKPVVYVAGNHEFWGTDIFELIAWLETTCEDTNVHYLEKRRAMINGVRFLGGTFWTDYQNKDVRTMASAWMTMNDFKRINNEDKFLTPADLIEIHEDSLEWLLQVLDEPFDGKTVVVTHHAPSVRSWKEYPYDPLRFAYCTDLEVIMEKHNIALWVHGHIHYPSDYLCHKTRVVCNPRGYHGIQSVEGFNPTKLIEL